MDDIEERLRSHAQAFDGLLSLIPAKYYYGDDTSDQWQRKKQTKEQARQAKRAKLNPDSAKTAKDVLDENARKRKRDQGEEAGADSSDSELGSELPKEGLKRSDGSTKKQKSADGTEGKTETATKKADEVEARKKLKEEKTARKKAAQKEKRKAKEEAKKGKTAESTAPAASVSKSNNEAKPNATARLDNEGGDDDDDDDEDNDQDEAADVLATEEGFAVDFNPGPNEPASSNSSSPNSPNFDGSAVPSGSSSISSIVPPTEVSKPASTTEKTSVKPTPEELKQRLQKRLDELRARRQADGLNGKPARNRQELIEARRQKAEQRKAHKKLLRQKAKEEEQRIKDEAMARRFSPGGSGSLLASPRSPADSIGSGSNNFAFGRVIFADGQQADSSLSTIRDTPDKHGPRDPAAALKAAEAKKARLGSLDEQKRAEIEAKDMWLTAKKRAHGERVRDDTSLLKKALKRKESAKKKSEREWKERLEGVAKGRDIRQAKREENLRKRRDEKGGNNSKNNKGGKKSTGPPKRKARPGFEGSFKAKVGGKKK